MEGLQQAQAMQNLQKEGQFPDKFWKQGVFGESKLGFGRNVF